MCLTVFSCLCFAMFLLQQFNLDLGSIIFYVFGCFWAFWGSWSMIILGNTWSDVELSSLVDNALMEFQLNKTLCWYVFIQPLLLTSSFIATGFVDPHWHTSTNAFSLSPVTQIFQLYQCKLLRLGALLHIQAASRGGLSPPLGTVWRVGYWLYWPSIRQF